MKYVMILTALIFSFLLYSIETDDAKFFIPDSTETQIIKTYKGSVYSGKIIETDEMFVLFQTDYGLMRIPKNHIIEVDMLDEESLKNNQYWYPNPNSSRLFFAPTARMLKQGEGYFADYFIFFPTLTYGVTNYFTLGGGLSIIPAVDLEKQIFLLTPKFGIKTSEKLDLAVGALLAKLPDESTSLGILYGVGTFGTTDKSFTLGAGYGYVDDDLAEKPMVVVGGESRVSRSISVVSENWLIPEKETPILSFGLRFFGEKLSTDFALIFPLDSEVFMIPYIDLVYKF